MLSPLMEKLDLRMVVSLLKVVPLHLADISGCRRETYDPFSHAGLGRAVGGCGGYAAAVAAIPAAGGGRGNRRVQTRNSLMKERRPPRASRPDSQAQQQAAEQLAIAALSFIAAESERLGRFLALSGIGPESIRAAAREPNFLLGVLDHVLADEPLLLAFAVDGGIDPQDVTRARATLAGARPEVP